MNKITVNFSNDGPIISRYIYGHFAEHLGKCIYDGFFVGENSAIPNIRGIRQDIIEALKEIKVPVLRWPGGCFADEYHWMDGIGDKRERKESINTHWGMVTETNHFGTHEFFDLCDMIGCDAYVAGNLGSGTVKEMQDWVDYISCEKGTAMSSLRKDNGRKEPWKLPFFGVGNESWACGGNMTPQYYSDLYRQYQTYVRNYPGNAVKKIACGAHDDFYEWTDTVMKNAASFMWGLSLHYYTTTFSTFSKMGEAVDFEPEEWDNIIRNSYKMDTYIKNHSTIMDKYDPDKKVAMVIDEWGTWYKAKLGSNKRFLHQQNTIRDAVSASIHFNIFHKYCDRVKMANLAQTVNVLQAVILTDGETMIKTPTYHVFDLYKYHQDNISLDVKEQVETKDEIPYLSSTASFNEEENTLYFSISNSDMLSERDCQLDFLNLGEIKKAEGMILYGDEINSHNTKENPDQVSIKKFTDFTLKKEITLKLPPRSVVTLILSI
ncbi:MAG: alpha-N-arabinofuranosidase [Clostridia bacterium]|nr:alpha-N-arabinofuranosidase [Clostridia bacterium]